MPTITYVVVRPFTYAGVDYKQGQTWEPQGSRNDAAIIRGRMVTERPTPATPPARKAGK